MITFRILNIKRMKEHVTQITMLLKRLFDHLQLEKEGKEKVYISL